MWPSSLSKNAGMEIHRTHQEGKMSFWAKTIYLLQAKSSGEHSTLYMLNALL